jgi:hypothetical protein
MSRRTYIFAFSMICRSCSAFCCIWGIKCRRTIFMLRWAQCRAHKKCVRTRYAKLVFLHMVRPAGHLVCSGTLGMRNVNTLFFMPMWTPCGSHKKGTKTHYVKLLFLHPVRSVGHIMRSSATGAPNIDALFFMLLWAWCGSHKKHTKTRYIELVFFASSVICGSYSALWCI